MKVPGFINVLDSASRFQYIKVSEIESVQRITTYEVDDQPGGDQTGVEETLIQTRRRRYYTPEEVGPVMELINEATSA